MCVFAPSKGVCSFKGFAQDRSLSSLGSPPSLSFLSCNLFSTHLRPHIRVFSPPNSHSLFTTYLCCTFLFSFVFIFSPSIEDRVSRNLSSLCFPPPGVEDDWIRNTLPLPVFYYRLRNSMFLHLPSPTCLVGVRVHACALRGKLKTSVDYRE